MNSCKYVNKSVTTYEGEYKRKRRGTQRTLKRHLNALDSLLDIGLRLIPDILFMVAGEQ